MAGSAIRALLQTAEAESVAVAEIIRLVRATLVRETNQVGATGKRHLLRHLPPNVQRDPSAHRHRLPRRRRPEPYKAVNRTADLFSRGATRIPRSARLDRESSGCHRRHPSRPHLRHRRQLPLHHQSPHRHRALPISGRRNGAAIPGRTIVRRFRASVRSHGRMVAATIVA